MRACLNTIVYILLLPGVACWGAVGGIGLATATGNLPLDGLAAAWFVLGYVVDLGACGWVMPRLADNFRVAATHAVAAA